MTYTVVVMNHDGSKPIALQIVADSESAARLGARQAAPNAKVLAVTPNFGFNIAEAV
jgi:hypothetical protein